MTETSLNGWVTIPTASSPELANGVIPGTTRRVTTQRDCLPLFLAFYADWHRTVHSIDYKGALGPDGWEYRQARAANGFSNHASGTAVDVTYDWLKADHARHMSPGQILAVHRLLDKYVDVSGRRVFGWGGDWTVGTYCDEMHTELAQSWAPGARGRSTTKTDVLAVIKHLGIHPDGTTASAVKTANVTGRTPLSASQIAAQLGCSVARVLVRNPWLAVRKAAPGAVVRLPNGVAPVPLYAGPRV